MLKIFIGLKNQLGLKGLPIQYARVAFTCILCKPCANVVKASVWRRCRFLFLIGFHAFEVRLIALQAAGPFICPWSFSLDIIKRNVCRIQDLPAIRGPAWVCRSVLRFCNCMCLSAAEGKNPDLRLVAI